MIKPTSTAHTILLLLLPIVLLTFADAHAQDPQKAKMTSYGRGYLEYLPSDYKSSSKLYPAIIFLHGSGQRGRGTPADLEKLKATGPPKLIKNGERMCFTVNGKTECFIVLSPQMIEWNWKYKVVPFVQYALQTYRIDPNRVYVTGLSMGGEGAWLTASYSDNSPNLFAAIAPIAGRAEMSDGANVAAKKVAVWAFHGDKDRSISLSQGTKPITGMLATRAVPVPIFTIYPGVGHGGAWDRAYRTDHSYHNPNLYEWFLMQKKGGAPSNVSPTVNAGTDQNITLPVASASLKATASDADGKIVSYSWTKVSGPSATLSNATTQTLSISKAAAGTYVFRITVKDNNNQQASDDVKLVVNAAKENKKPTVSAGADKTITLPTNAAALSATAADSDGKIASYTWTKVSGPSATLANATTQTLSISNAAVGTYVFRITVKDDGNLQASADVKLIVKQAVKENKKPTVSAGADKTITLPTNAAALSATATDSDGKIASYSWVKVSGPSATLSNTTSQTLSVSKVTAGTYVFRIIVKDDDNLQASADVKLVVKEAVKENKKPTVSVGSDKTITLPANAVSFSATATDSDGKIASYAWTKVSGPSATLANTTAQTLSVSNAIAGTYVFRVTVKDNGNLQASADVKLIVKEATRDDNKKPEIEAGQDKTITLPLNNTSFTVRATDADGAIASYKWTQIGGCPITMKGITSATLKVSNATPCTYVFKVEVKDNKGATAIDFVKLHVNPKSVIIVDAGEKKTITLPVNSASLTTSARSTGGYIVSYKWTQIGGCGITMSETSSATLKVSNAVACTYVFRVEVKDNTGATGVDSVWLSVDPAVVEARGTQATTLPATTAESTSLTTAANDSLLPQPDASEENQPRYDLLLGQNYPNPFTQTTTIPFTLDKDQHVVLKVFDSSGKEVITLLNEELSAGTHEVQLNASSLVSGSQITSYGTFYYKLFANDKVMTKRFALLN